MSYNNQQCRHAYLIVVRLQLYDAIKQWHSSVFYWYHSAGLVHECSDFRIRVPHEDGVYSVKGSCTELAVFEAVEKMWQSMFVPCPTYRKGIAALTEKLIQYLFTYHFINKSYCVIQHH